MDKLKTLAMILAVSIFGGMAGKAVPSDGASYGSFASGVSAADQLKLDALNESDGNISLGAGKTLNVQNIKGLSGGFTVRDYQGNGGFGLASPGGYFRHYSTQVTGASPTSPVPLVSSFSDAVQELTISSGAIAISPGKMISVRVDTESGAASDDLQVISGGCTVGDFLLLGLYTTARTVTVKDRVGGSDNILLNTALGNFTFANVSDTMTLYCYSSGAWGEVSRSTN